MKKIVLILGVIAALASCKVGKNYEQVEVQTDSTFRFSNDTVIEQAKNVATLDSQGLKWWELFKDPLLDSLISEALINNQSAKIAASNMAQAELYLSNQKSEMLPQFDANAGIARGNYGGFITPSASTNWFATGVMNWEIDFWGKYRRLNEAAKADYLSSQFNYRAIQLSLISRITSTYYELLANKSSYQIAQNTLSARDSSLLIIQQRFDQGIIPEIDLNQAQIQKAIAQSAIPFYERRIALAENTLSFLVGSSPKAINSDELLSNQDEIPEIPTGLPSELLKRRPDILAAEQQVVASNSRIGAAQAARLPSINLTGLLGVASSELVGLNSGNLAWNLGTGLTAPLFHFGRNKRRVEIEKQKYQQAVLGYEQAVITSFKEVEDALVKIETYKKERIAREYHVKAALNAQELSKQRYDKGVTSYLEYLEQQRQAFDAQLQLVQVNQSLYIAYVELYKALGGGWPSR